MLTKILMQYERLHDSLNFMAHSRSQHTKKQDKIKVGHKYQTFIQSACLIDFLSHLLIYHCEIKRLVNFLVFLHPKQCQNINSATSIRNSECNRYTESLCNQNVKFQHIVPFCICVIIMPIHTYNYSITVTKSNYASSLVIIGDNDVVISLTL